ncbi:transposase IS3/IS911 family protein [Paenibacillus mucilaginosus 3016]|uniref:Transposase IS3/IS911 family protein n=1 Tax=Paenibacillus mucilaginosus 3016 TaxID=1116391 RepID=H6NLL4_9BACL|nr:transposase [Paenibacillus mucilaginosus]AFC29431.1 transposase IS3/IS911 family protein [Paenibacillus mucilaginosus 3016]AFC30269.1 transposase IS3/IS911 family protein [Paenibacillus mucilaginosus 3016]AFC30948.1 transposase IS3/IS911 family protein [Paenibacillus mucilaginosus 3016]AFC32848.1 transposase IS3/IS911 family protein [Paenibacillus mucilaginosus 3016]AFC33090.1 transposase IS3/IS911 family protein [Paenibacillus mucilaginosus 3016]
MSQQRESYDSEFKKKTVEHIEKEGKKPIEIARELGIPKSTLSRWIKQYGKSAASEQSQVFVDYERLKKLEQQNRELQEENEILKKAMHFFTKDRD